jgi:hypothetical protein
MVNATYAEQIKMMDQRKDDQRKDDQRKDDQRKDDQRKDDQKFFKNVCIYFLHDDISF